MDNDTNTNPGQRSCIVRQSLWIRRHPTVSHWREFWGLPREFHRWIGCHRRDRRHARNSNTRTTIFLLSNSSLGPQTSTRPAKQNVVRIVPGQCRVSFAAPWTRRSRCRTPIPPAPHQRNGQREGKQAVSPVVQHPISATVKGEVSMHSARWSNNPSAQRSKGR